ncbi:hypothetical protein BOTBODRAFT_539643 [Botryobasidium botryosum FD-172 SS1]|uniref:Uncharacterized protein n=1 Tax=Botryobasidium botryosum (strain FD-172 SS1) TaxID=930990 RepID=A0A067LZQ2_BOTB1|nr:hypothetical protein BOTBODRAFT_539643 [Botryobasidium botryosum FD-172 SS1]
MDQPRGHSDLSSHRPPSPSPHVRCDYNVSKVEVLISELSSGDSPPHADLRRRLKECMTQMRKDADSDDARTTRSKLLSELYRASGCYPSESSLNNYEITILRDASTRFPFARRECSLGSTKLLYRHASTLRADLKTSGCRTQWSDGRDCNILTYYHLLANTWLMAANV